MNKRLIAHRGVWDGEYDDKENRIETIIDSLQLGYDVEVDVCSYKGRLYLGHDEPQEPIKYLWDYCLDSRNIWYHCKDLVSLEAFSQTKEPFNFFWHDEDSFTLTSHGNIWTAKLAERYPAHKTVIVVKEKDRIFEQYKTNCFGICSSFVGELT